MVGEIRAQGNGMGMMTKVMDESCAVMRFQ